MKLYKQRRSRLLCMVLICFALSTALTTLALAQDLKPEKPTLEVAIAAYGSLYLPLLVAQESGAFTKRGLTVHLSQLSATASAQVANKGTPSISLPAARGDTPATMLVP